MDYFSIIACALFLAIMLCLIGLMLSRPITRRQQKRHTHQTAVEAASAIVRAVQVAGDGNERDLMHTISSDGEARPPHTIQEPEESEQFLKEFRLYAWDRGISYTPEQQIALWHVWQRAEERRRKAEAEREAAE